MSLIDNLINKQEEKTIRIECEGTLYVNIDDLIPLQKYKELSAVSYERGKQSILTNGFSFPIFIWEYEGKMYIIDAHQRKRILTTMRDKEVYIIPPLPAVRIFAKNKQEAKKKILAQESRYGDIIADDLYAFINEEDAPLDEIELSTFTDIYELNAEVEAHTPIEEGDENDKGKDCQLCAVYHSANHESTNT